MAWTTLPSYSDGNALTAAQVNAIADNINQTAPAKATTDGSFFVVSNTNEIEQREMGFSSVSTSETTTSTTFTDLTTAGPEVTIPSTGPRAITIVTTSVANNTATGVSFMAYDITGSTSQSAVDTLGLRYPSSTANENATLSCVQISNLTSGTNTWTAKYRASSGTTASFGGRRLGILAF